VQLRSEGDSPQADANISRAALFAVPFVAYVEAKPLVFIERRRRSA
jgi:hypothetical protein